MGDKTEKKPLFERIWNRIVSNEIINEFKVTICIGIFFCAILGIGCYGFSLAFQGSDKNFWDCLYLSLQLFVLESGADVAVNNYYLEFARFVAPILTISAFALVMVIVLERLQKIRLLLMNDHIIICGLGYLGLEIARYYKKNEKMVIVVEKNKDNPNIQIIRELGIPIIIGDATLEKILNRVHLKKARDIYLVTGKDNINAEIAVKCTEIKKAGNKSLWAHIHFENKDLWKAFGVYSSHSIVSSKSDESSLMQMEFFNLYYIAGFCILNEFEPFTMDDIRSDSANILIIGLGRLGENILSRIVKKWEKANDEVKKIRITCIDINAEEKKAALYFKYGEMLEKWCDLSFVRLDLTSHEFRQFISENSQKFSKIYICLHNSSISALTALRLVHDPLYENTEIIVRATYDDGITRIFKHLKQRNSLGNINIFPIVSSTCCMDMIIHWVNTLEEPYVREKIAQALHENYRKTQFKKGEKQKTDPALKPWDLLQEDLKDSNRKQADHIREHFKKYNIGLTLSPTKPEPLFRFSPSEIEILAKAEHERWIKEKMDAGWKLGPKRDYEKKESPYLIPYKDLPEEIKELDREPFRRIPEIISEFDLKIIPLSPD